MRERTAREAAAACVRAAGVRARRLGLLALGLVALAAPSLVQPRASGQLLPSHAPLADIAKRGPWPARHRRGVRVAQNPGAGNQDAGMPALDPYALSARRLRTLGLRGGPRTQIPIASWPAEPRSPASVDVRRFTRALRSLCPPAKSDESVARIASATVAAAEMFDVDPFVLGALAYHQSDCDPHVQDSYGIGLTRIHIGMHNAQLRSGAYHFHRPLPQGGFARQALLLEGRPLSPDALRDIAAHMQFAAAFLHVFEAQCPAIDAAFGSAPHRHPVSHMIFGDSVRSALPEALVLTARRRLLTYYDPPVASVCKQCSRGLGSPLDGAPRIVIGVMGDLRGGGQRLHRGIDLMASRDEPVRAVAAGVVVSAGVDLREEGLRDLSPEQALRVPLGRMGPRGLFVRVEHRDGRVALYAHLARYRVRVGDVVERGQQLGDVGLTGVHTSSPHLHFGFFEQERALDPLPWLEPHVLAVESAVDQNVAIEDLHERLRSASMPP